MFFLIAVIVHLYRSLLCNREGNADVGGTSLAPHVDPGAVCPTKSILHKGLACYSIQGYTQQRMTNVDNSGDQYPLPSTIFLCEQTLCLCVQSPHKLSHRSLRRSLSATIYLNFTAESRVPTPPSPIQPELLERCRLIQFQQLLLI